MEDFAESLARRQGKVAQPSATEPVGERADAGPAADRDPTPGGDIDNAGPRRDRTLELHSKGRRGISLSLDNELWDGVLDEARRERTTGSAIIETLVLRHMREADQVTRAATFAAARELTSENRRRR